MCAGLGTFFQHHNRNIFALFSRELLESDGGGQTAGAAAYQSVVQLKLRPGDYYQTADGAWVQK